MKNRFIAEEHNKPQDCQVLIAMTGDAKSIKLELESILRNIEIYGKPMQGIIYSNGCTREVITPVWNKHTY